MAEPDKELSDHSLLRRFREGSQDAATQLYLRYANRLRALAKAQCSSDLARRVEVEDLVQSVFKSFFRKAGDGYYDVPAGEELWKLFLVMALNKIRAKGAYHRAAKRDVRRTSSGEQTEPVDPQNDPDYALLRMVVAEALERLPPRDRTLIELRIEGYEVAEIAARSQRSKRTVERVLQEFRKILGDLLQQDQ